MKENNKTAKKIGRVLAHVQSTVDDVVQFGFKKMKEAASEPKKKAKAPETLGEKGKEVLKKTASFLGQAGEAFYESYEKLKAEKVGKKGKEGKK